MSRKQIELKKENKRGFEINTTQIEDAWYCLPFQIDYALQQHGFFWNLQLLVRNLPS